ncbi:MAG: hypothetical protein KIT11_02530 [Fimbriimonadaceae bacterium]|nr:hypothetical protein [Fimbriimonadaceae bacterium]QYK54757.1 MAG: hypothetical protein KF733_07005 [Fimbriimonadaceae bacterium]
MLASTVATAIAQELPTPTFGRLYEVHKHDLTGTYNTYRMGTYDRLGLGLGSQGGYLTTQLVSGKKQVLFVNGFNGLSGATTVAVIYAATEFAGFSDKAGSGIPLPVRWTGPGTANEINVNWLGGQALRVTDDLVVGYGVDSFSGDRISFYNVGSTWTNLNRGGYANGIAQAVSNSKTAIAGSLTDGSGNGLIALWTRSTVGGSFGSPTVVSGSRKGYVTSVVGGELDAKVYGWLEASGSDGAQPFVYSVFSETLTLLGKPSDLGPIEQSQSVGTTGIAVGNRSGEPFLFFWSDEDAGSGIANDLASVLLPETPSTLLPRNGTFVSGVAFGDGAFGGKDIGASSGNNAWVAVTPQTDEYDFSELDSNGVEGGQVTGGDWNGSRVPDGTRIQFEKFINPVPNVYVRARWEHTFDFEPKKRAWFRLTARCNTTGFKAYVLLYNYSTSSYVELGELAVGQHMKTVDVELPDVADYVGGSGVLNGVKAKVELRRVTPSSNDNPVLEVEQARWIAEK